MFIAVLTKCLVWVLTISSDFAILSLYIKKEGVKTLFLTKSPLLQISVTGVIFIFLVF